MGKFKFHPPIQVAGLRNLQETGYIMDFDFKKSVWGNCTFTFRLTQQKIGGEEVSVDFSKYKLRIEYYKTLSPHIYIDEPSINNYKHKYSDGRLCLYHQSDFKWGDDKSIALNLIPWVYTWIYYNEIWLKTGIWYGEEYQH